MLIILAEIRALSVSSSRGRVVPLGVKRKTSDFPLRPRRAHPTRRADTTVHVITRHRPPKSTDTQRHSQVDNSAPKPSFHQTGSSSFFFTKADAMRFIVPAVLVLVALIHALPVLGVLGADKRSQLYGVPVREGTLELLLRHRAVLLGLLAAFLAYAGVRPELHRIALGAGFVSVISFMVLAHPSATPNTALTTVVRVDWVALVLLMIGALAHFKLSRVMKKRSFSLKRLRRERRSGANG
ncbi:MAG: hypothetical protein H7305_13265 [Gemmatimonadaceae bacterium]|nr:hypothetical protein [Gemmatimonadaceae bacterium]